jgi:thioredoxin
VFAKVDAEPGALPAAALAQVITAVRELDMEQVRSRIAEPAARR